MSRAWTKPTGKLAIEIWLVIIMSTSDEVTTRIEADPEMQQAVATTEERSTSFFRSRRFRKIAEASLAYLFLLPAFLIVFIFGIYPIAFSIYQSTQRASVVQSFGGFFIDLM